MAKFAYAKMSQIANGAALRARFAELGIEVPVDDEILTAANESPLANPITLGRWRLANRWCIHPMEGWDAHRDGSPSEKTLRRWRRFGESGAKLIWGGEAAAVQEDGRANPNQTLATAANRDGLAALLAETRTAHAARYGSDDDLVVGLQLTHSGRYSKPNEKTRSEPRIAYHHPILDRRVGVGPNDDAVVWTDDELKRLIDRYVDAARMAGELGFEFVDVKSCHGYLLHEFLSAREREGEFGGDYEGRTRLLRTIIERIRTEIPELAVGVRLSVYDSVPFEHVHGEGHAAAYDELLPYRWGFGLQEDAPMEPDFEEPIRLLRDLQAWGVVAVNLSCGSPYYNPHLQRPAMYPPSDGYPPPEDPLLSVARQLDGVRRCKEAVPDLLMVGTGYSYLQELLPQVAQAVVRAGWVDVVGLGRMVLSYPELPADALATGKLQRKLICRTFSDCTTGPRNGLVSGCYPLDTYYKSLPEASDLAQVKRESS